VEHTLVSRTYYFSEILQHVVDMHDESLHWFTCTQRWHDITNDVTLVGCTKTHCEHCTNDGCEERAESN